MSSNGKRKSVSIERHNRIQFHIIHAKGLRQQTWWPLPSVSVTVEGVETKESHRTEKRKSGDQTTWGENLPIMDLNNQSKIKFVINNQIIQKSSVLCTTDTYELQQLLTMQKCDGREAYIDLDLHLISNAKNAGVLRVNVREITFTTYNQEFSAEERKKFVDNLRRKIGDQWAEMEKTMNYLSDVLPGSNLNCLVNVMFGMSIAAKKVCQDDANQNLDMTVVDLLKAINASYTPYLAMSSRKLTKSGNKDTDFMKQIMCHTVEGLLNTIEFMQASGDCDGFAYKVADWIPYFKHCEAYIHGTESNAPEPPKHSRRPAGQFSTTTNPSFPSLNMVDIYLPEFITQGSCDHPDLVHLISQWAISPAFKPSRQVFCLLGNEGCGKTQLAGNIMESFNQLGFLGAYFTFDLAQQPRGMTSKQLLDSLPVTVAHQLSSVIPDIASHVAQEIKNNAMIQYDASLDNKFERLLTKPLAEVAAARAKVTVKPVEPLIFVIDDLDKCTPEVLAKLLAFFKGVVFKNLPSYVRFLLLGRPSDLVDQGLKDVAFVHEMVPIFEPSLPFVPFSTRAQATSSSSSSQGVRISGGWSLGTPYTGKDKYDPSGHLHLR